MKQFPFPLTCLCLLLSINYPLKQYVCSLPVTFAIQPQRARGPTPLCVHSFQVLAYTCKYTTYIYLHIDIYTCIQTHTYTNIHAQYTNTCASSYIHACTIYTHRYKHIQMHPNIHIHAHRNTHTCMHKHIRLCTHIV